MASNLALTETNLFIRHLCRCIKDLPAIFNFPVLAKVLSKLVEETPLPSLFMLTLIASATSDEAGPRLTPTVVVTVLRRCVGAPICLV